MSMEKRKRGPWIQVEIPEDERTEAKQLADVYGTDVSTLVRLLLKHANETRPTLKETRMLEPTSVSKNASALVGVGV